MNKRMHHNELRHEFYPSIKVSGDTVDVDGEEISAILTELRCIAQQDGCRLNFDDISALSDEDYSRLTGLNKVQFKHLDSFMSSVYCTSKRASRTTLVVLLVKLRTGLSLPLLSTMFGLTTMCCRRAVHAVRQCVMEHFVPSHLGLNHITREEVIQHHTTHYENTMFGSTDNTTSIAVADGTYIYIEKSSNYEFQRRSFSLHKDRPLVKPMMVVATDGYILSGLGPYLADGKNNDANITRHPLDTNTDTICELFKDYDVLIVDRGFRDVIDCLTEKDIKTEMLSYLPKSPKPHTDQEANESRLVTKVRWVVESANGRIKQWKALSNVVTNNQAPYIGDYVREKWDKRRSIWNKIDQTELEYFPVLTESELRDLTLGVYQIKQAKSYMQEHLSVDGNYEIMVHAWYCQCKCGSHVVGFCAHIASVLWYLGYYRHNEENVLRSCSSATYLSCIEDAKAGNVADAIMVD